MTPETAVQLARQTLATALWLAAPILIVTTLVSLIVSIAQVVTSIQEMTVSTVPRLATVAIVTFVLLPWMLRKLTLFAAQVLGDFQPYLG